jgi:hypothetical protein
MSAQKRAARRSARTYGDVQLHNLQQNTFRYFWEETNPANRSGLIWRLMRNCPYVMTGLRRAGFKGDWL